MRYPRVATRLCVFPFVVLAIAAIFIAHPEQSSAQTLFVANISSNSVGEYDTSTGQLQTSITNDVSNPQNLAIFGNNLYVNDYSGSTGHSGLTEYNAATGAEGFDILNSGLGPAAFAVSGNNLFISASTLSEYDASTGAPGFTINSGAPFSLAASSTTLYAGFTNGNIVRTYNSQTGTAGITISTGAGRPDVMALYGNQLFVAITNSAQSSGTVAEFNATTGALDYTIVNNGYVPNSFAFSGTDVFIGWGVANEIGGVVNEYNTATASPGFSISTTGFPGALAVTNNELFISNIGQVGDIGEFNATTGAPGFNINDQQGGPEGFAIYSPTAVPEPSCFTLITIASMSACLLAIRRNQKAKIDRITSRSPKTFPAS